MPWIPNIALTLIVLCSAIPHAFADPDSEPDRLVKMRQIYEQEIARLRLPALKKLASKLKALEIRLTKENKLEAAKGARDERLRVEAIIAGAPERTGSSSGSAGSRLPAAAERKEFSIPMSSANLQGRLTRPGSGSYIEGWISKSCEATWSGGKVIPGLYDVYIDYDTRYRQGGGELVFEELRQDFRHMIPTGYASTTVKVGTFRLGTALGFSIRADTKQPYGIFRLRGVTFKPAKEQ